MAILAKIIIPTALAVVSSVCLKNRALTTVTKIIDARPAHHPRNLGGSNIEEMKKNGRLDRNNMKRRNKSSAGKARGIGRATSSRRLSRTLLVVWGEGLRLLSSFPRVAFISRKLETRRTSLGLQIIGPLGGFTTPEANGSPNRLLDVGLDFVFFAFD